MTRIFRTAVLALLFASPFASAADDDQSVTSQLPGRPKASQVVRQESLEMPGVTACHQCEWRPKPHTKAAAEQCGSTPDGTAKTAVFECGFAPDCERVCNFIRCTD